MSESPPATDVLIVGSGAAGLTAALNLADRFKVTVLAKGALNEGSTAWAQGGIAAVLEPGDTTAISSNSSSRTPLPRSSA
jgi:L-aspartate oxidase